MGEQYSERQKTWDGMRYAVAVQDLKNPTLYSDIFETDRPNEAESVAKINASETHRVTVVRDRQWGEVSRYDKDGNKVEQEIKGRK